jgi:hypothetical protein
MKNFYLLFTSILIFGNSCSKEDATSTADVDTTKKHKTTTVQPSSPTAATIYNPIVGKWELGMFKMLCPGARDTTIYVNEKGDFVEFRKDDTAFYTYNTTKDTGLSSFKILDSLTFILGDTMHIVSFDGVRLTTYTKLSRGGAEQWMTYKSIGAK